MRLGEKLQKLRGARSYAEIAGVGQCSSPTIRDIESGNTTEPGVMLIAKLARHFAVSMEWLTDEAQGWPPPPATLDDKIVHAVRQSLVPFQGLGSLSPDERAIIDSLRSRDITNRDDGLSDGMFDAIDSLFNLWDSAHDVGLYTASTTENSTPSRAEESSAAGAPPKSGIGAEAEAALSRAAKSHSDRERAKAPQDRKASTG